MINKDRAYCTGLQYPVRTGCQRYVDGIKDSGEAVRLWTDGEYNKRKCELLIENKQK